MKGLSSIPGIEELQGAYSFLQTATASPTVEQILLWSQWARFDPRLAEVWIDYMGRNWKAWSPMTIQNAALALPWPAAMGPLFEHIRLFKTLRADRKAFGHWMSCAMSGCTPATGELYFIALHALGGKSALQESQRATRPYSRWGYAGTGTLINKDALTLRRGRHTLISKERRAAVLRELLRGRDRITVSDYVEALQAQVSRRTAELDLKASPQLKRQGNTRAASYRKRH